MNGTIFAYGVTSSGKTHTMSGTAEDAGVIGRALADVFAAIAGTQERDYLLRFSMMEIYNEVCWAVRPDTHSPHRQLYDPATRYRCAYTRSASYKCAGRGHLAATQACGRLGYLHGP